MMDLLFTPQETQLKDIVMKRTRKYSKLKQLNALWHSILPNCPAGMRVGFIFYTTHIPIACAIWGRPSARQEDQLHTLELTRLAHSSHVPHNFGSWAIAKMRTWIRENMPDINQIISYQDANIHHGTIYKADNWHQVYEKHNENTWANRPGRKKTSERKHKIKWARIP